MSLAGQRSPDHDRASHSSGVGRSAGFDFTFHIRRLCEDMVARVDWLRHIELARVAVSFSQARKTTSYGVYASLTPLRFAGGVTHTIRRGQKWGIQRLCAADGREMLYILNFYLPRFLDLKFRDKLDTVMHELWHIGPRFDGDVRRFDGRCFAHGSSQQRFHGHVERLVDLWLASGPPESLYEFLRCDFRELQARHGRVFGRKIPAPKLIRVS